MGEEIVLAAFVEYRKSVTYCSNCYKVIVTKIAKSALFLIVFFLNFSSLTTTKSYLMKLTNGRPMEVSVEE